MLNKIMQSEKRAGFIILSFILLVASFNLVASLVMLLLEKQSDLQTIYALGGNSSIIKNIFIREGMMISLTGSAIGLLCGFIFCWLQIQYGFIPIAESDTLVISSYPVAIKLSDFIYVFITASGVGLLASIYPARRAAKMNFV